MFHVPRNTKIGYRTERKNDGLVVYLFKVMKKSILKTINKIVEMAIGVLMLGGVIKEDWLHSNVFVWSLFFILIILTVMLTKLLQNDTD